MRLKVNGLASPNEHPAEPRDVPIQATAHDPLAVRPEQVRQSLEAKVAELMVRRLRSGLLLALGSYALFLINDIAVHEAHLNLLILIKVVQVGGVAMVLLALRHPLAARHAVNVALGVAFFIVSAATVSAIIRGNATAHVLLLVAVPISTATMFPWGTRAQAILVGTCLMLACGTLYAVQGTILTIVTNPSIAALLTAQAISLYVAYDGERYRWQIEEQEVGLRLREEHFRSLIENGADLIVLVGVDGTMRSVSPSVQRLLGHLPSAWVGTSLYDVVHPDDAPVLRATLAASAGSGAAPLAFEVRIRDAGSSWHVLLGTLTNLLAHPAVEGIVLNAHDITELRQTAEKARRNQADLTHVLRLGTIGEIASGLAHEINQPLGAVSNYAAACARWLDSGAGSTSELRHGLELISAEALRAGEIIRRVRDLARKNDDHMQMVDLNEVVRRALELVEPEARTQGISLQLHPDARLPRLYVDPIQIQQVMLNLVLNAIEAMHASAIKQLTIRTRLLDAWAWVDVTDTGSGLDPRLAEGVFEPFFTTKPTGLGMGLAISRRIVEAHGGKLVGASNDSGRGSTFSFSLPPPR